MEKKQSARELFLNTITKMGIKYENNEDEGKIIWFDYQDMWTFDAEEDEDSRYITLEYIDLRDLGDTEDVLRMRRIINKVNKTSGVVISTTNKTTHYRRKILFIKEIPDIEDYLRKELQALIHAYEMVNDTLHEELKMENKNTVKRASKDIDSTETRDLFIKTITEMDCKYEPWENKESHFESIVFEERGMKYRATFFEFSGEVLIENHYSIYGVELSDQNKVSQLREAINNANLDYQITTTYAIDNESGKMYADTSCVIPFFAEMPQLIHYLHDVLDRIFDVEFFIKEEMETAEEIEKLGYLNQKPN